MILARCILETSQSTWMTLPVHSSSFSNQLLGRLSVRLRFGSTVDPVAALLKASSRKMADSSGAGGCISHN